MFDKLESRYILNTTVTLQSGLHIGSGRQFSITGSDSPVMKDYEGYPFIPGSSFKGVMRSALESVLRGLDNQNSLWSCCHVPGQGCVEQKDENLICIFPPETKKKEDLINKNNNEYEQFIFDHSCHICRLFGSSFLGSKLFIKDLQLKFNAGQPEAFSQIEIRDFVAIDRDTATAKDKGKFDCEIVPTGTQFELEMVIENPEVYEMGLIFMGFDFFNEGYIKLGGLVSRGLGKVFVDYEKMTIKKITPQNIFEKDKQKVNVNELKEKMTQTLQEKYNSA